MSIWKLLRPSDKPEQQQIQTAETYDFLQFDPAQNPFLGLLIDYEFFFLKKNFSRKLKKDMRKTKSGSIIGLLGFSKKEEPRKTPRMSSMISNTIFKLDDKSDLESEGQQKKKRNKSGHWAYVKVTNQDTVPLIFDSIIECAIK